MTSFRSRLGTCRRWLARFARLPQTLRNKNRIFMHQADQVAHLTRLIEQMWHVLHAGDQTGVSLKERFDRLQERALLWEEQGHLLQQAIRYPQRAAAEAALRARLPAPPTRRLEGVSILIPCWNHGGLLRGATASALAALDCLPVPGEVLILDDASRDESQAVANELSRQDERIHLLTSAENLGLARARNVQLTQSRFRHAMLLDADNELIPAGLPILYEGAVRTGAVLTYGNIVVRDTEGQYRSMLGNERVQPALYDYNWIDTMCLVDSEALLELGGFNPMLEGLQDWELNLRLLRLRRPMTFVPTLVGRYRSSKLSMVHDAPIGIRHRLLQRMYAIDGLPEQSTLCGRVYHSVTDTLWRSPEPIDLANHSSPPQRPRGPRYLVVSSAGVRNHGDDAILLATLDRLERLRPGCRVVVVSDGTDLPALGRRAVWAGTSQEMARVLNPELLRRGCAEDPDVVATLERLIPSAPVGGNFLPADPADFDAVLFCGGGNLNAHWPTLTAWRTAIAAAARARGVPCLVSGQGIGPLSEEVRPLLAAFLRCAARVAVRDPASAELLREDGLGHAPVDLAGDDALGLTPEDPQQVQRRLAQAGVPWQQPKLGFHVRSAPYVGWSEDALLEAACRADEVAAALGYAVVTVPINTQPPLPEAELLTHLLHQLPRRRVPWFVADSDQDVAATAGVVKACTAVLTCSFHIALFALESRIPTLLFTGTDYYSRKADGLHGAFGLPVSLATTPTTPAATMIEKLEQMRNRPWSPRTTAATVDCWLDESLSLLASFRRKAA